MEQYFIKSITVFCIIIMISCNRPICNNTNPVFNTFAPDTKQYKDELLKQLERADKTQLTYWLESYQQIGNSPLIYVSVQGGSLCAKLVLTIATSRKGIEGILKNKGEGYIGAELENLKFKIKKDHTSTEFIFQEISGIID